MRVVDKRKAVNGRSERTAAMVLVLALIISTWLAPVTNGGLANLATFTAWAIGLAVLVLAVLGIWLGSVHEEPVYIHPVLRWAFSLGWWIAVAWAAYHGMHWLAALHTLSGVLLWLNKARKVKA
ncbi:hypothetical protein SAMN04487958_107181 [Vreelandella subterranea]|uniref:Uncharacterized protein n=1 Tax=Vreelandella subterranea TaxID=416874 RepID=A0A1H9US28_9GAMM|nr:hypothetical protein [Halomonas subterranea]SES12141.1 hypothetical protein SAMN04487958_107181 [Halomonas subterranea]